MKRGLPVTSVAIENVVIPSRRLLSLSYSHFFITALSRVYIDVTACDMRMSAKIKYLA